MSPTRRPAQRIESDERLHELGDVSKQYRLSEWDLLVRRGGDVNVADHMHVLALGGNSPGSVRVSS